ncbi:class I SAM-dependent methyltransferase [Geomonas anaerohicana]|uniref:Class I SAM-dependent methyltransferase n=1 Tax=Geomonas anaerohicana TaxID=2798583 RepID=A0ABS0YGK3_9BACT|nr:class I SAM-dependent methyltransferase [Geomonas anaerohicana]MBJ6751452.1 class I SAM-dependent methyltransferase [Geomonas anaerohicana]
MKFRFPKLSQKGGQAPGGASPLAPQGRPAPHCHLEANVLTVRNLGYLQKALGWSRAPILEDDHLHQFAYLEDLNDRRLRDAEVLASACCNGDPGIILEIGTSHGRTTALLAVNAPLATVYTVNIPPEEIAEGGKNVTFAPSKEEIGSYYRAKGLANVRQIFANTARWEPDFGPIDVAFIDGCHDAAFVYNDTRKILKRCRPGSIIVWHDFNPELARVYGWINEVCSGVEQLYRDGILTGRILHLQDSWTGLYVVAQGDGGAA